MAVELRPLGVKCNIQCQYCYQNPQRDAGNVLHDYDFERMIAAVEAEGGDFALFGGEPLLLPLEELERLWAWGLARNGENSVQTNGTLVTDAHLELFKKYNVAVGLSLDGPGDLNDARWAGSVERTRDLTARVESVIAALCAAGTPPRMIVTLHRGNATRDKLPAMKAWFRRLEAIGVRSARLHLLEVEHADVRAAYALTAAENREAVEAFADLERELRTLRLDLFEDMRRMLLGRDETTTCVWNACDPYTTRAVRGVEGNGQRSNCGRTNKEGIEFAKAAAEGFERYLALYHTPQEVGGCRGCRFFLMCKGQCPGTGLGHDWRNRSEHCDVWKAAYGRVERELLDRGEQPLSLSPLRKPLEDYFVAAWVAGRGTTMAHALRHVRPAAGEEPAPPAHPPGADRLDFVLPAFTRVAWVSDEAREAWAPRFDRVRRMWREMEWVSVAAGLRQCAAFAARPEQLEPGGAPWAAAGLHAVPLGGPGSTLVAVGRPADAAAFARATEQGDEDLVGRLLGHPDACRTFHRHVWVEQGRDDPTWPMALATGGAVVEGRVARLTGPPQANLLWRWLGVRPVFHMPGGFDCPETVAAADRIAAAGRAAGFAAEFDLLYEILSWPVEWSALHGIAEVRTPVLKLSTRTDATAAEYAVRWAGAGYPAEGATGLRFPYRTHRAPLLTLSTSYRRGLAHAAGRDRDAAAPAREAP